MRPIITTVAPPNRVVTPETARVDGDFLRPQRGEAAENRHFRRGLSPVLFFKSITAAELRCRVRIAMVSFDPFLTARSEGQAGTEAHGERLLVRDWPAKVLVDDPGLNGPAVRLTELAGRRRGCTAGE